MVQAETAQATKAGCGLKGDAASGWVLKAWGRCGEAVYPKPQTLSVQHRPGARDGKEHVQPAAHASCPSSQLRLAKH